LKAGPVEALFDLALALHRTTPLRVAMRTKAETGLALVTGRPPPTPSAPPLTLIAVATVADGFRHIVRNGINHLLANEPAVREAGPAAAREGLHQMGAALRRLRTAFALFGDTIAAPEAPRLDHELRWIARRLKPARAWDKAATLAWAPFAASHPDLDAAIAAAHAGALEQARSALAAPRFMTLILELGGWLEAGRWLRQAGGLERPLVALASPCLARCHRKVIEAERHCRRSDTPGRHRVGVRLRRLREAVAILRGLYPAQATRPYCEALDALSALLNDLDDRRAVTRLVGGLAAQGHGSQAADRLIESLRPDPRRRLAAFTPLWRRFVELPPFWI
jgi:inorganic triphosphatase YgiF